GKEHRVEIPVLAAAHSTLKAQYPGYLSGLQAPSVLGSMLRDDAAGERSAELGPATALTLVWPAVESKPQLERQPRVEEFTWLQVQPDALVLDAKWKFLENGEPIEQLEVLTEE